MNVAVNQNNGIQAVIDDLWREKYKYNDEKNLAETIARFVAPIARVEEDIEHWTR